MCVQKQSSRGVVQERCSANIKQTHRSAARQKRDLKQAAWQLY